MAIKRIHESALASSVGVRYDKRYEAILILENGTELISFGPEVNLGMSSVSFIEEGDYMIVTALYWGLEFAKETPYKKPEEQGSENWLPGRW